MVGEEYWQRALHPHPRDRASFIPELQPLLEASGRLELVEGEHSQTLGDAVRFSYSDGHTPGLMLAEVGGVVFCADLIPGRFWVHLPITMGYDRYPEMLIDEKRAFLEDKLARDVRLFFTHDPGCAMARVTRDERGRFGTTDEQRVLRGACRASRSERADGAHWTCMRGLALDIVGALLVFAGIGLVAMTARGHARLPRCRRSSRRRSDRPRRQCASAGRPARLHGACLSARRPWSRRRTIRSSASTRIAPVLTRHVEMFQWREVRIGGGVHYELDWVDRPIDASHFEHPAGHANPGSFPVVGKQFDAGLVRMGGFKLAPVLLHALPGSQRVTPDMANAADESRGQLQPLPGLLDDQRASGCAAAGRSAGELGARCRCSRVTVVARVNGDA